MLDAAPLAQSYYSDASSVYDQVLYHPGQHQLMFNKSQTYSVEADDAKLVHYLAHLPRQSPCFLKLLQALTTTVRLFFCWNQCQLHRRRFSTYPFHLIDFASPIFESLLTLNLY